MASDSNAANDVVVIIFDPEMLADFKTFLGVAQHAIAAVASAQVSHIENCQDCKESKEKTKLAEAIVEQGMFAGRLIAAIEASASLKEQHQHDGPVMMGVFSSMSVDIAAVLADLGQRFSGVQGVVDKRGDELMDGTMLKEHKKQNDMAASLAAAKLVRDAVMVGGGVALTADQARAIFRFMPVEGEETDR